MDRDEALTLLGRGQESIAEWNRRRRAGEEVPSLSGAHLPGAYLSGADLSEADLREADLRGADLHLATLSGADLHLATLSGADLHLATLSGAGLREATLSEANLSRADLCGADLSQANLRRADVRGAALTDADFSGADLSQANLGAKFERTALARADFREADCSNASFSDTDLSESLGLHDVQCWERVRIDALTAVRSRGRLPQALLDASHLPTELLELVEIGDLILIEFKRSVWGQLIPIEHALRTKLGDKYIVEKSSERILVVLDSPDQFQDALECLYPVLAGLEAASPGEIARLSVRPRDSEQQELADEQLSQFLRWLIRAYEELAQGQRQLGEGQQRIIEEFRRPHPKKSGLEGFMTEGLRGIPVVGGIFAHAFQEAIRTAGPPSAFEEQLGRQVFETFRGLFTATKPVLELPAAGEERPPRLPASTDDAGQEPPPRSKG